VADEEAAYSWSGETLTTLAVLPSPAVTGWNPGGHVPQEPAMRRAWVPTIVRFATVGVANTAIDVALFWVLHAPLGILAANFVSTSAGMVFSFAVNGRHTFGAERVTARQAGWFLATNAFTMWLLQPALIHAAYDVAHVPLMAAKVVALGGSVVANFLLYRYVVWPERARERDEGALAVSARESSKGTAEPART
jgi:putative flippase GtrA